MWFLNYAFFFSFTKTQKIIHGFIFIFAKPEEIFQGIFELILQNILYSDFNWFY